MENRKDDLAMKPAAQKKVDLNCDFGEGFGIYSFGEDGELVKHVASANIACGFHAGDPHTMRLAVEQCLTAGVAIGAHPGLPDRLGFGRRRMELAPDEAYDYVLYQLGALGAFAQAAGSALRHMKPHGALYHMANADPAIAEAVVRAAHAYSSELLVYAQSGSLLLLTARAAGMHAVAEVFPDRAYLADGALAPRHLPGACLSDAAAVAERAVAMVSHGQVYDREGVAIPLEVGTLCLHGDHPGAGASAALLRSELEKAGIEVAAPQLAR